MSMTCMTKQQPEGSRNTIAIVGGGAAGLMAAIVAVRECRTLGTDTAVMLFEPNERLGRKLRITGKGRCNLTNACDRDEFLANIPTNPRFLYSALADFSTQDTQTFFEALGVPLKVERGKRVFPVSDRASDIAEAMARACDELGVRVIRSRVEDILIDQDNREVLGVLAGGRSYAAGAVIVCTGGCSYPVTGSDGGGYRFAEAVGHTVVPPVASLVPIVCEGDLCARLMGLSLRNVRLQVVRLSDRKKIFEDFGEMLFTHYGMTGPLVLSASAHMGDLQPGMYEIQINLKPALDENTLDHRIVSDFQTYSNRDFINALDDLLPQKAIEPVAELSGIDFHKKVHTITKEERHALREVMQCLRFRPLRFRPIREAIVTKGGVSVKEIRPKTMESKLISGLYFAGEILDVDGYTGGFNLQIAFSTAVAAGRAAAETVQWSSD